MSDQIRCPRCKGTGMLDAPKGLAARILLFRDEMAITNRAIEQGTGISHATLHRILHGADCTVESLVKLADFFRVSTDELLGRAVAEETPARAA